MKPSTRVLCLFFVVALAVAAPVADDLPPPDFTSMERATINGILEKHTLPDVIKLLFNIEAERSKQVSGRPRDKALPYPELIPVENVLPQLSRFTYRR